MREKIDPMFFEIIEFAGIKVKNGQEVDRFQTLIKPEEEIDEFITELTGITNEMLEEAPVPKVVLPSILDFIGNDILIAHNAHFDINFLYDYFEDHLDLAFNNNFICTMRLARRVFPDLNNHKLKTICNSLNIEPPTHRSLQDAIAAWEVYNRCQQTVYNTIGIDEFLKSFKKKSSGG